MKLGLIGYPLGHSFSPKYFSQKFKEENIEGWKYDAYPLEDISMFSSLWEDKELIGVNVTIPYKEKVIPFLDELSEEAQEIQAVNTIKKIGNKLIGFNTDAYGFEKSLQDLIGNSKIENALILGTGGASKAIRYVLDKKGISYQFVSRTKKENNLIYSELNKDIISNNNLIINTTPLGTFPQVEECPNVPYEHLSEEHFLYDLVYNPAKTLFLSRGEEQGAKTINGLPMLHLQAEKAWQIWTKA